jgi:ATP-binding cassette subfamily B protein
MNSNTHPPIDLLGLPFFWQKGVLSHVHHGENVLAWLEVDLNDELIFKKTLVILTDQRVISADEAQKNWNFWALSPDLTLRVVDHAGVGTLALQQGGLRLVAWRFTLGLEAAVLRWKLGFENHLMGQAQPASFLGQSLASPSASADDWVEPGIGQMRHVLCPVCQSVVDAADEECANCLDKEQAPTSTWTLFKLWRFAKPYQWQLLMGFLLTLASTAATLVPPYLTMPLMDDVLIPYQNGKSIDPVVVSWYLLGLFASAIVAWSLGWIKTYIFEPVI